MVWKPTLAGSPWPRGTPWPFLSRQPNLTQEHSQANDLLLQSEVLKLFGNGLLRLGKGLSVGS